MLEQSKINTVGLIPSRWGSTRFEGKPLAMISGQPMIQRVYDRASMSKKLDEVYVVTDDDRIENYCNDNDLNVIRIDNVVPTGTDRIALTLDTLDADIYVNIQGDEPLIDPDAIDKLIESYTLGSVSNAYVKIEQDYKNSDINVVFIE
jgi:3-deoxy-manno-octulosonate cytidylyltransferase (CMP-KDO synthetase)